MKAENVFGKAAEFDRNTLYKIQNRMSHVINMKTF